MHECNNIKHQVYQAMPSNKTSNTKLSTKKKPPKKPSPKKLNIKKKPTKKTTAKKSISKKKPTKKTVKSSQKKQSKKTTAKKSISTKKTTVKSSQKKPSSTSNVLIKYEIKYHSINKNIKAKAFDVKSNLLILSIDMVIKESKTVYLQGFYNALKSSIGFDTNITASKYKNWRKMVNSSPEYSLLMKGSACALLGAILKAGVTRKWWENDDRIYTEASGILDTNENSSVFVDRLSLIPLVQYYKKLGFETNEVFYKQYQEYIQLLSNAEKQGRFKTFDEFMDFVIQQSDQDIERGYITMTSTVKKLSASLLVGCNQQLSLRDVKIIEE